MRFCVFFVLQLHIAASLVAKELPALLKDIADEVQSKRTMSPTHHDQVMGMAPWPENIAPGKSYLEPAVGCTSPPEWAKTNIHAPAIEYNTSGWNGFCEAQFPLCPDAVVNKDYSYYWAGLGPDWVKQAGKVDGEYCRQNGWLKPEFRAILHDFEALQAKGKEECQTKWSNYGLDTVEVGGLPGIVNKGMMKKAVKVTVDSVLAVANKHEEPTLGNIAKESLATVLNSHQGDLMMDPSTAHQLAAWNCAMGDVSCDIAYCNHAYCEKSDGTVGMLDECEGYDLFRGMPV